MLHMQMKVMIPFLLKIQYCLMSDTSVEKGPRIAILYCELNQRRNYCSMFLVCALFPLQCSFLNDDFMCTIVQM